VTPEEPPGEGWLCCGVIGSVQDRIPPQQKKLGHEGLVCIQPFVVAVRPASVQEEASLAAIANAGSLSDKHLSGNSTAVEWRNSAN
jgi:hypothetical protein